MFINNFSAFDDVDGNLVVHKAENIQIQVHVALNFDLQSWNADRLSKIQFSIRPARSWDSENDFSDDVKRWSDLYVFCLYASKDRSETPLQLEQWEFYLLPTSVLNIRCKDQKSISLSSLLSLSPTKATYEELRETVDLDLGSTPLQEYLF